VGEAARRVGSRGLIGGEINVSRVLFVCTGNIFRSLTAEYALRDALLPRRDVLVSSAGTEDFPHVVRASVSDYLLAKGIDVRGHERRTLTRALLQESRLVVAMSTDHRSFLSERFGVDVPLYTETCGGAAEALPDIEDVIADYRTNSPAVDAHVRHTIDRIVALAPEMAKRIDALLE
jgi:protein-tyrosine phosphatase